MPPFPLPPRAVVGGLLARDLVEVRHDPQALDEGGRWAVVLDYEGRLTAARFARWEPLETAGTAGDEDPAWTPVPASAWTTSLGEDEFRGRVAEIRERIAAGDVYQVNLCRVLRAPLAAGTTLHGLHARLTAGHPAPHAAHVFLPEQGVDVACASPELFLRRDGERVVSRPIKGTAATADGFLPKDRAENVMIVDLVRNDLGRVCVPGSVRATAICAVEHHPGLAHLVSTVEGRLRPEVGWPALLEATFPAGSIVGAPKLAAQALIDELEPTPRGPYCGAIGWVDGDRRTASLAVGIRSFWRQQQVLRFGTGGGITWDSDPEGEWRETELKAARLLAVAGDGGAAPQRPPTRRTASA
ncbi:chorismate-binding protein [Patulibacter defluvii]|uniref:chorismate-binding protein n=1 Tax=Patulibacter defluvii TaxID=3095358 RepID=UPI002A74A1B1|nr:chorismate-binding protein [Patulibacter sp. DM4]